MSPKSKTLLPAVVLPAMSRPAAAITSNRSNCVEVDCRLDDSGSLAPVPEMLTARKRRMSKSPADTVIGCRDRAEADLVAASTMSTKNGQLRMEASSASWAARADMLQRMDNSFDARMKAQHSVRQASRP